MVDMYDKVVSTKLTDEEHSNLLEVCNQKGCTPSKLIRNALLEKIESEKKNSKPNNEKPDTFGIDEFRKALRLMDKERKKKLKSNSCIFTKYNDKHKINQ